MPMGTVTNVTKRLRQDSCDRDGETVQRPLTSDRRDSTTVFNNIVLPCSSMVPCFSRDSRTECA